MSALYSRGEVLWLLSITYDEAVGLDAIPRDSCLTFGDGGSATALIEDSPLLTVLRWHDVHAARRAILATKLERLVVRLRAAGFTERDIATVIATPKTTVRRHFDATLNEIIRLLGEGETSSDPLGVVASCLVCGIGERVRLGPVLRKRRGKWRVSVPARTARVCADCLRPELAYRLAENGPQALESGDGECRDDLALPVDDGDGVEALAPAVA
jgi:hypothetical protein